MTIASLHDVTVSFGLDPVLDEASFTVGARERVCLVGRNGQGKSTLLKVLNGTLRPEQGKVTHQPNLRYATVPQEIPAEKVGSVFEVTLDGLGTLGTLLSRFEQLTQQVTADPSEENLSRLQSLQDQIDDANAWDLQSQVEGILERHKLDKLSRFETLSGGMKRRVLIAKALVQRPGLLLLDEPTNHLDVDAICWLEEMLKGFPGAIVFVSHDRQFIDHVATRIVDVDRGKLSSYPAPLSKYQERKAHDLEIELKSWQQFDRKLKGEEIWIRQGIQARRTRNEGRVRALKRLRTERRQRRERLGSVELKLSTAEKSGRIIADLKDVHFAYEKKPIISGLTTTILRGDRVGIIGPNGAGKTTLLKLILGELTPSQGELRLGTKRSVLFLDQMRDAIDDTKTVFDNISDGHDTVQIGTRSVHVLGYLKKFLFSPLRAKSPVLDLSGGERNRLLLAKLFTQPANILVLDEPTNDLDTDTLEMLELMLLEFEGTLLLVSHDRTFLDNVVTSTLAFDPDNRVRAYPGGYADWCEQRPGPLAVAKNTTQKAASSTPSPKQPQKAKLSYRDKRRLEALPEALENAEKAIARCQERLNDPTTYLNDTNEAQRLSQILETLEAEYESLLEEWVALESLTEPQS